MQHFDPLETQWGDLSLRAATRVRCSPRSSPRGLCGVHFTTASSLSYAPLSFALEGASTPWRIVPESDRCFFHERPILRPLLPFSPPLVCNTCRGSRVWSALLTFFFFFFYGFPFSSCIFTNETTRLTVTVCLFPFFLLDVSKSHAQSPAVARFPCPSRLAGFPVSTHTRVSVLLLFLLPLITAG